MKVSEIEWLDENNEIVMEIKDRFKMLFDEMVNDFNNVKADLLSKQDPDVPEEMVENVRNSIVYNFMHYALGCEAILSGESEVNKKVESVALTNKYAQEARK